jgi:hypothetical protein
MAKRTSLANLGDRLAPKAAAGEPEPDNSATAPISRRKRQPDGRKGILVRARPEAWRALKQIALDGEHTLQDVMTAAINDFLGKHGKPPLA